MADDKIMEALARIEHKLDLVLLVVFGEDPHKTYKRVGDPTHCCSLCHQNVEYQVDINDGVVLRKCGCKTGKIALDLGAFAPPALPARKNDNGGRDDEQEDRSNPDRGSGKPRGR